MAYLIQPIYFKWQTQPTITTPASTNYPIWNIDFPAVTICSNTKVVEAQLKRVLKKQPWNETAENYDDLDVHLKNSIAKTILFEVEPHLLESNQIHETVKNLLDIERNHFPKVMQQVKTLVLLAYYTQSSI